MKRAPSAGRAAETARGVGRPSAIVDAVVGANRARRETMARKVVALCGGSVSGQRIAAFGVTFKANTDDMREAPALDILPALLAAGAEVVAYDPQAHGEARQLLPGVAWAANP